MLGVLFVSFLQAVAGAPAAPPTADEGPAVAASERPADADNEIQQERADDAADERQRMRCRTEAIVGSRLGRRVCMTQAEEDAWRQDTRDFINRAQIQRTP